jgi:uncharacterized alpha-E superfamily protein
VLSRVANALFWIGRSVERAEHMSRQLDVHLNLALDRALFTSEARAEYWRSFLDLCQDVETFNRTRADIDANAVSAFVVAAVDNPDSIVGCIGAARENAREVRESISSEVWEQINTLYWSVHRATTEGTWSGNVHTYLRQVQVGSHLLTGLWDQTMSHDEGWHFLQLGRYFDRIVNTSRLLEHKLSATMESPADPIEWAAILKCCSAYEAYRRSTARPCEPQGVAEFLLGHPVFPRAVRYSAERALVAIRQVDSSTSRPMRILGRLAAHLEFADLGELGAGELREFLGEIDARASELETAVHQAYFQGLVPRRRVGGLDQQQQQQQ